jgi:hypothetical protein
MVYQTSAVGWLASCGATAASSTPPAVPEFLSYWNPLPPLSVVAAVVLSCDDGPWVVSVGDDTFAFAAMASTITTGEFSNDDDDDDAADVLEDGVVVVVVAVVVVANEVSVEEKAVTFRTGIGVVGETVDDVIITGGGVGNGATEDEDTIDPGIVVAETTPCCSFINCPWEGVAYPHTTLTYMSNVPQLFNLSSVPHSPVASHGPPRSTSRQLGNSVSSGQ